MSKKILGALALTLASAMMTSSAGLYGLRHRQGRDCGRFDDGDAHLRLDER